MPKYILTGDKELERKLRRLPEKIQRRILPQALRYAGRRPRKLMRAKAKAGAPWADTPHRTGMLAKSIGTTLRKQTARSRRTGTRVLAVGPRAGYYVTEHHTEPQAAGKYANVLEHGWQKRHGNYQAYPFMRQTYEQSKATVGPDFRLAIGKKIEKLAAQK